MKPTVRKRKFRGGGKGGERKMKKAGRKKRKKSRNASFLGITDVLVITAGDNFALPNKKFSYKNTNHILLTAS